MHDSEDKKIMELLEQLPKIEDERNKDELYDKISKQLPAKSSNKHKRIIPLLAAAASLFLLLGLPLLINQGQEEQHSVQNDRSGQEETFITAVQESNDSNSIQENSESSEVIEPEVNSNLLQAGTGIIQEVPQGKKLVHLTIRNAVQDYVIPVALLAPSSEAKDAILDEYNKTLGEIFNRYGFNEIIPADPSTEEQAVDKQGSDRQKASYLLFQGSYYAMIPQEGKTTVNDALQSLKNSIPEYQLEATIKSAIKFNVQELEERLVVEFEEITKNEITIPMIESILLTAKDYGFEEVLFTRMPVDRVGDFHFARPIPVPLAANPIKVAE